MFLYCPTTRDRSLIPFKKMLNKACEGSLGWGFFFILEKDAKNMLRTILSCILELRTNTLPIFILEYIFIVEVQTSGKNGLL